MVTGKLVGVQYLRAMAALLVVVYHLTNQLSRLGYDGPWAPKPAAAVDVFFVISGFIIAATAPARPSSPIDFWLRRLVRLAPLYWLLTGVMLIVLVVSPTLLQSSRLEWSHVIKSFLFIPAKYPGKDEMAPLLMPGWAINYEVLFCLVLGVLMTWGRRAAIWGTAVVFLLLFVAGKALAIPRLSVAGFYASGLALDLAAGLALGALAAGSDALTRVGPPAAWIMFSAGLIGVLAVTGATGGRWTGALAAVVAIAGAVSVELQGGLPRLGWIERLGDASYSIYLLHTIMLAVWLQVWVHAHLPTGPVGIAAFVLTAVALSLASGIACHRHVELPLTTGAAKLASRVRGVAKGTAPAAGVSPM